MLLATAFGFVVATVYLALAEVVEALLAALLTAVVLGGAAGVVILSVRYRKPRKAPADTVAQEALLLSIGEHGSGAIPGCRWRSPRCSSAGRTFHSSSNRPPDWTGLADRGAWSGDLDGSARDGGLARKARSCGSSLDTDLSGRAAADGTLEKPPPWGPPINSHAKARLGALRAPVAAGRPRSRPARGRPR